jgi:pilus assembly protein FimV
VFAQRTLTEYQFMSQKTRVKPRSKFMTFSLKTISASVVSAVLFSNAYGAGLGKLTVLSSLGQPLHAEIELTSVSKEEAESLSVKLASVEAFRQANIEFNPALFALRFALEQRGGRQFVRVTSTQPINEPFVDMLLELGGGNSRLVREYTFLLDPPDLRRAQPAQIAAANAAASSSPNRASQPVTRAESVPQQSVTERPATSGTPKAPATRADAAQPRGDANPASSDDYQVKSGDTLVKIANQYKPEGISLDQMLIALQRANPNAFIDNNINRLRTGQILSIPDAETARGISNSEAKGMVIAQSADFSNYRNKLADQAANAVPQKSDEARQSASGKITAKVDEQPTAASEAKDKLKLSRSGAAVAGTDKGVSSAAEAEDRIAKEKALAESNARVRELEKNVADLQKLLEIKNRDLAERQKQADAAKAGAAATSASGTAAAAPPAATASPLNPAAAPTAAPAQPATPAPAPAAPAASDSPAVTPAAGSPPVAAAPVPAPASNAAPPAEPATANDTKAAAPKVEKPAAAAAKANPAPSAAENAPGFVDDLLENPLMLSLMAALLAGLGALGIYSARRKKLQKEFDDSNTLTDSSSLVTNSLFGSTGGQSVDTNNSVFNSNFAPSASQLDTNEVDPVAEADVYIAYGRDAQAEEILKEALRTQPERNAVRLKLLEIYASRKDLRAFEMLASELYSITKGEGEEWEQAAGLGIEIDPQNPLYAGGKPPDTVAAKTAALTAPTQPLEELNLDALLNTTQASAAPLENLDTVGSGRSSFDNSVDAVASMLPDLDMKAPSAASEAVATPVVPSKAKAEAPAQSASMEEPAAPAALDFDFDLPDLGIKEPDQPKNAPAPAASTETGAADNGLDFDFNLDSFAAEHAPVAQATPDEEVAHVQNEELAPLDLNDSHITSEKESATSISSKSAGTPDFDLSGISLDLTPAESIPSVGSQAHEAGSDSNVAEMATKLDLAIAYQEIGDKEGARELLDEVVKGGTSEQTEKAKLILQKIA